MEILKSLNVRTSRWMLRLLLILAPATSAYGATDHTLPLAPTLPGSQTVVDPCVDSERSDTPAATALGMVNADTLLNVTGLSNGAVFSVTPPVEWKARFDEQQKIWDQTQNSYRAIISPANPVLNLPPLTPALLGPGWTSDPALMIQPFQTI